MEGLDYAIRPERALLGCAKLGLYANLRPAKLYPMLADASTLKREVIDGIDLLVVRELTGGIYFGKPRGVEKYEGGTRDQHRSLHNAGDCPDRQGRLRGRPEAAEEGDVGRQGQCLGSDRALAQGRHRSPQGYPDVALSHMYVDNCAMQLIRNPKQFDVLVTTNLFGDILSDEAAMLTGSIGMLLRQHGRASGREGTAGMYEPIHGSAPTSPGKTSPIRSPRSSPPR